MNRLLLALDTATEQVVAGVGRVTDGTLAQVVATDGKAPRQANAQVLTRLSTALADAGVALGDVHGVVVGRGPGSFTGVRIGVATAKGLAQGLGVPLYGVGTLDAIAHSAAAAGLRGLVGVVGDAMRGEVYPALFRIEDHGVARMEDDSVARPADVAARWAEQISEPLVLLGNGLSKHADVLLEALADRASVADEALWLPTAQGTLAAFVAQIESGSAGDGEPATVLPVYTRLSDAEEAERERSGRAEAEPPANGVAGEVEATPAEATARLRAMATTDLASVAAIEASTFPTPWSHAMFEEELGAGGRTWLVAERSGDLVGYAGLAILDDVAHVMNLAVVPEARRKGVGRMLLQALESSARASGASSMTLEAREGNPKAIALYEASEFSLIGRRKAYYADSGEDALIMTKTFEKAESAPAGGLPGESEGTLILAIETSCDETAAAVMQDGRKLLSNVVSSQIAFHSRFGGVVPEIASRKHTEAVVGVVAEAMAEAGESLGEGGALPFSSLDAIAVTYGPGLVGALVVGLAYAKGLSMATGLPLVGVNHLEGHIFANVLADPDVSPPLVALIVSGGHTSLVHMPEWGSYRTLGETLDDAAGEAFDKVAKVLGLGYPGGPVLSKYAETGDAKAIDFPRAMMKSGDYRFSLSGLKTAVINHIRHEREAGRDIDIPDLAASFQAAVVDVQVAKAAMAVAETGAHWFVLGGGVAANPSLRDSLRAAIEALGARVSVPPFHLCTDNAAMIAAAAYHRYIKGERLDLDAEASPGLRLDS